VADGLIDLVDLVTCSFIHRNSLMASSKSLVPLKIKGRSGDFVYALSRREFGSRGMKTRPWRSFISQFAEQIYQGIVQKCII
jgi:hypothetical protein